MRTFLGRFSTRVEGTPSGTLPPQVKERIDARNGLESYLYNMKNTLDDEEKGVADKLSADDKEARPRVFSGATRVEGAPLRAPFSHF